MKDIENLKELNESNELKREIHRISEHIAHQIRLVNSNEQNNPKHSMRRKIQKVMDEDNTIFDTMSFIDKEKLFIAGMEHPIINTHYISIE